MRMIIAGTYICAPMAWRQPLHYMLVSALVFLLLSACNMSAASSNEQADTTSIYSAVIRQIYTHDDTSGGTYQPQTLYILQQTMTPSKMGAQSANPTQLTEETQSAIVQQLHDVPTKIVWVTSMNDAPRDGDGMVANHGAIITIGPIERQSSSSVHVTAGIFIAPLGAGGRTYVVEQNQAGTWQITGTTGEQWIS